MDYWSHVVIKPEAKKLLEKNEGSIHKRFGPYLLIIGFDVSFLSYMWIGRLDYMSQDAPKIYSVILEGNDEGVISTRYLGNNRASMLNWGRSLLEIEFEGPGFRVRET